MRWAVVLCCVLGMIGLTGCATSEVYVISLSPGDRVRVTDEDSFRDELLRTVPAVQHSMGLAVAKTAQTGWLLARSEAEKDRLKDDLHRSGAWRVHEVERVPQRDLSRFLDARTKHAPADRDRQ